MSHKDVSGSRYHPDDLRSAGLQKVTGRVREPDSVWKGETMQAKKLAAVAAAVLTMSMALAGCGVRDNSANEKDDGSLMQVEVFDWLANYQGIQKGWFAKMVKDTSSTPS